jgi:hypothetical protein
LIDLLGMLLTNQYSTLILIDMLRGVFSTYGWGWPVTSTLNWNGAFFLIYIEEFVVWWIFPIVSMLWWRSWANKHPQLVEEL